MADLLLVLGAAVSVISLIMQTINECVEDYITLYYKNLLLIFNRLQTLP